MTDETKGDGMTRIYQFRMRLNPACGRTDPWTAWSECSQEAQKDFDQIGEGDGQWHYQVRTFVLEDALSAQRGEAEHG